MIKWSFCKMYCNESTACDDLQNNIGASGDLDKCNQMQADKEYLPTYAFHAFFFSKHHLCAMPPNIKEAHNADADSPFPIEYEDTINVSSNSHPSHDSPQDSQSLTKDGKEPQHAGPTFLSRLSQLPIQRSLPWRDGQELPPERSSDSERVQQRGACLLATRGSVAVEACTQCAAGRGRFTHCITLGNWFQGACASCVFTSRGNRCGLRVQKGMWGWGFKFVRLRLII